MVQCMIIYYNQEISQLQVLMLTQMFQPKMTVSGKRQKQSAVNCLKDWSMCNAS